MVELFTDPNLFSGFNAIGTRNRNCRIAFLITFFTGGIIGGLLSTNHIDAGIILFLIATIKFIASLVLLILSKEHLLPSSKSASVEELEEGECYKKEEETVIYEIDSEKGSIMSFSKSAVLVSTTEIV